MNLSANQIISPLMTNEKSPNVMKLIGIDTSIIRGLIVWLMIASTIATSRAVHVVAKVKATVENTRGTPTFVI